MEQPRIPIQNVARQTLSQKAYESLKASILQGHLKPGARLQEVKMAKQLNVSAAPVREAFRMLASEGLVRIDPWKGVVVQEYSEHDLFEVYQCRISLEALGVRLTSARLDQDIVSQIDVLLEDSTPDNEIPDFLSINDQIHQIWIANSDNSMLCSFMEQINKVVLREINFSAADEARRIEVVAEHAAILTHIKNGEPEQAVDALKRHLSNGYHYATTGSISALPDCRLILK